MVDFWLSRCIRLVLSEWFIGSSSKVSKEATLMEGSTCAEVV